MFSVFALLRQSVLSNQQFRNLSRRQITRNNRISSSSALPHSLLPLALSHSPFLLTAFSVSRRSPHAVQRLRYFFILCGLAIQKSFACMLFGRFPLLGVAL
jgi:hypothetical protein